MKTSIQKIVLSLMMSLPLTALAADRAGNGGDVVLCPGEPVQMLDSVELKDRGQMVSFEQANDLASKLEIAFQRIKRLDPIRAEAIQKGSQELLKDLLIYLNDPVLKSQESVNLENTWFTNRELEDIPDSHETSLKPGCAKKQLVIQLFPGDWSVQTKKKYTVQKDLLLQMSLDEVAVMVLHEAWYFYAHKAPVAVSYKIGSTEFAEGRKPLLTDSRSVRLINALFLSEDSQKMTVRDYFLFLRHEVKMGYVDDKLKYGGGQHAFYEYTLPVTTPFELNPHSAKTYKIALNSDALNSDGTYDLIFPKDYSVDQHKNYFTASIFGRNQMKLKYDSSIFITKAKLPAYSARVTPVKGELKIVDEMRLRGERIQFKNAVAKGCHYSTGIFPVSASYMPPILGAPPVGLLTSTHCLRRRDVRKYGKPVDVLFDEDGYIKELQQNGKEGAIVSIEWNGKKIKNPNRIVVDREGYVISVE